MFSALLYSVLLKLPHKDPSPEGWPSSLIAFRMYDWYMIFLVIVLAEMLVLKKTTEASWGGALKASAAANTLSALVGVVALPMAGVVWKYTLQSTFETLTGLYGHYTIASWMGNVFYMAVFLGLVEVPIVLALVESKISKKFIFGWILVNMLGIGIALLTFFVAPPTASMM